MQETNVEVEAVQTGTPAVPKKSVFNTIAYYVLLGTTFLAPIFFIPSAAISSQFGTSLLFAYGVIAALLCHIVAGLLTNSLSIPRPIRYVLPFVVVVPLMYVVSGLANGLSRLTFFGYTFDVNAVGFILLGFTTLFLVSVHFKDKARIFNAYFAFLVSSILVSIFLLIRLLSEGKLLSFGVFQSLTSSMIGSWNNVGIFFGICAILSLVTFEMVKLSRVIQILLSVALLLSLFFLSLVNFPIIWLILGIVAFLFSLYSIFSREESLQNSWKDKILSIPIYPLAVFAVSLAFYFLGSSTGAFLAQKFNVTNVEARPGFMTTFSIAKNTLNENLFFGSGPNTFVNQWLSYKPDDIVQTAFWNTDFPTGFGLIPTFASTTGLLGILSWIVFFSFYLYLGLKSVFGRFDDPYIRYFLTSSFFISLYLWIMVFMYVPSVVIFVLTFVFTGLFLASVYLADIVSLETKVFSKSLRSGFLFSLCSVALFVGSAAIGYGLVKNTLSVWYFQKGAYALNTNGDIGASEQYMLKAIGAVKYDAFFRALSQVELLKLDAVVKQDTSKVKVEEIQKQFSDVLTNAISAGIAAKSADENNYLNWVVLGRVYETVSDPALKIEGAYDSAQFAYKEALKRNPKNPGILLLLSRLAAGKGDKAVARSYAEQAIQMKNNYLDAYFLLSQIEVADNNLARAIESVTAASVIDPTNPAIFFQLGLLKYNAKDYKGAITVLEKAVLMTPDYANAKYFLGLSYEIVGQHENAIRQFEGVLATNPESSEVKAILGNLREGKPIFEGETNKTPEKGQKLPVKENIQ